MQVHHLDVVAPRILKVAACEVAFIDMQLVRLTQLLLVFVDLVLGLDNKPEVLGLPRRSSFTSKMARN